MTQLQRFEDMVVWQDAMKLAKEIYNLCKTFPKEEIFGLTSQIKRSSTSVSANLAEGFGRFSRKDKHNFYTIAYGSLLETKNFLYLSVELGFCNEQMIKPHIILCESIQKQCNALMKSLRS